MSRRAWGLLAAAVLLIGVAVACTCIGGGVVLFCGLIGLISAALPFETWCADHGFDRGELRFIGGVLCGSTLLGLIGLATVAGALGWWVGVLLVSGSWPILRRPRACSHAAGRPPLARRADAPRGPTTEQIPEPILRAPATVPELSTVELCWTWRVSYVRLLRAVPSEREALARLRAALLEELQGRDPVAFSRWLPTARAASDPARFFHCPDRPAAPGSGGATEHPAAEETGCD